MNSGNSMGDNHLEPDGGTVDNVSRSGRVRKKNSLLALYDSPDVIEKKKRRENNFLKNVKMGNTPGPRSQKTFTGKMQTYFQDYPNSYNNLEKFNHNERYSDDAVPDIGGEEVIDDGTSEEETRYKSKFHANNVRLKSQAESTYMMEKTFVKQKKVPGQPQTTGTRKKATRKDKGSPRVTAYMLWAKDQRANFIKRFPHMDFSSLSKKLSDLWATVPQNQKRMWKTKAAKIMKKAANGTDNIKNSTGSITSLSKKNISTSPHRKLMKNTTPEEVQVSKRPPGRPPKKLLQPAAVVPGSSKPNLSYTNVSSFTPVRHKPAATPKRNVPTNRFIKSSKAAANTNTTHLSGADITPNPIFNPALYPFKVNCETGTLDAAAHLSLLGESMKTLGSQLQNSQDQDHCLSESLSSLLNSLLCAIGPLLCLTQQIPELNCIPDHQLQRILSNVDYVMPGI